ncbi:MAG: nuclear transport factor 2 family protein [Bacteroidota bacterium]
MKTSLAEIVDRYRSLLEKGDNLAVIDLFYGDAIEHIENNELPIVGRTALRAREEKIVNSVHDFSQTITSIVIDEEKEIVMGEMDISFNSKKHGPQKLVEAFVQHWKNGKIVYQKFYYNTRPNDK